MIRSAHVPMATPPASVAFWMSTMLKRASRRSACEAMKTVTQEEAMAEALTLVEELATVPDPRSRKGRRHPLTAILSLTVVATLAGCKSLEAIAQFGRDHGPGLAHALGFRRKRTPAKSTLSEIFRAIDLDSCGAQDRERRARATTAR